MGRSAGRDFTRVKCAGVGTGSGTRGPHVPEGMGESGGLGQVGTGTGTGPGIRTRTVPGPVPALRPYRLHALRGTIAIAASASPSGMSRPRNRPSRPSDHPASAMQPPTMTIAAVSDEPTPANPHRQPPNITSVQAHLPGQRKAPPASRPSGPLALLPNPPQAGRQRTARRGPRRRLRAMAWPPRRPPPIGMRASP